MVNLMFYGIPASGKTTKIYAFLASLFNKKVYDLKNVEYTEDRKTIIYRTSIYHIEVDPITLGSGENLFISSFLKTYTETKNIGLDIPKIILIKNAHLLSNNSQMALRKIIEKSSITAKFIFEVNSITNISSPLLSRFLLLRVSMPSKDNIINCLKNYSIKKNIIITDDELNDIIDNSCKIHPIYNLKKIFGFFRYYISTKTHFKFIYYDSFFEIYNLIKSKKISFISFQKIRELINEMYINLVPMYELLIFIFSKMQIEFIDNPDKMEVFMKITSNCNYNLKKGNKECLHLEHYIISIIDLIH